MPICMRADTFATAAAAAAPVLQVALQHAGQVFCTLQSKESNILNMWVNCRRPWSVVFWS